MTEDISDETLMYRYRDGDLAAFKELYRRHRIGLYRFIAWRSPRQDWVDEIVQDCWAALHAARARYQADAGFRTYLYQIARHRLIDLLRQKQNVSASELEQDGDMEDVFQHIADVAQETLPVEEVLQKKRQVAHLHEAIRRLPMEQKEALVLQQFNDMSLDDIAVVTNVSVETVKSRLRYAMQKLRFQLQNLVAQGQGQGQGQEQRQGQGEVA